MNGTLQKLCEQQVANEKILRDNKSLNMEELVKLGGYVFTAKDITPNTEKINSCKDIAKKKLAHNSNIMETSTQVWVLKMSLADNPEEYLDNVLKVFDKLIEGKKLVDKSYATTALTIYDQCALRNLDTDDVIDKFKKALDKIVGKKIVQESSYYPLLGLLVASVDDLDKAIDEQEEIYKILKKEHKFSEDAARSTAVILAMNDKSVKEKVDNFIDLYEEVKAHKCHTSKSNASTIYAAYSVIDYDKTKVAEDISEVEEYLKKQKGYGTLNFISDLRRCIGAALELQTLILGDSNSGEQLLSTVTSVITEEIIMSILMSLFIILIVL